MADAPRHLPLRAGRLDLASGVLETATHQRVWLTTSERAVLAYLAARADRDVPRAEVLTEVWRLDPRILTRAADDAVRRVRAKIEIDPASPDHVRTVHGVGWRFVPLAPATPAPPAVVRSPLVALPGCAVDLDRGRVVRPDREETLTSAELALLRHLLAQHGRPVARDELLRALWGRSPARAGRLVENTVLRLRRKIEADPAHPLALVTQRGVGYVLTLVPPDRPDPPIGREGEIVATLGALASARVVALVGPPGVGTSTVAGEAVRRLGPGRATARVALGDVADATLVARRVAEALEVEPAAVARVLADRRTLLWLDDADEALPALRTLAPAWVRAGASLLTAGAIRPELPGERVVRIDPLGPASSVAVLCAAAPRASPSTPGCSHRRVASADSVMHPSTTAGHSTVLDLRSISRIRGLADRAWCDRGRARDP